MPEEAYVRSPLPVAPAAQESRAMSCALYETHHVRHARMLMVLVNGDRPRAHVRSESQLAEAESGRSAAQLRTGADPRVPRCIVALRPGEPDSEVAAKGRWDWQCPIPTEERTSHRGAGTVTEPTAQRAATAPEPAAWIAMAMVASIT